MHICYVQARAYDKQRKMSELPVLDVEMPKSFMKDLQKVSHDLWKDAELDSVLEWAHQTRCAIDEKA